MTTPPPPTDSLASIVVGTDFTPCSLTALRQAIRIAQWTHAAVHVVHIIDTVVVIEIETALSPMQTDIRNALIRDAESAWREVAAGVPGAAALPVEVLVNNRIAGLLQRSREDHADLLVIGAFGDRRPDVGLGTVATSCVRKSEADVLLIRDVQQGPFKHITAAVDFSETSAAALARAAFFAAQDGAELHVLHVFTPPWTQLHYRASTPLVQPHLQKQYRDALERRLADFVRPILDRHPGLHANLVVDDDAGHRSGIVDYARRVGSDLIVLGTRGRSSFRDLLLGSTAEKVLDECACSVLAVKPRHPVSR